MAVTQNNYTGNGSTVLYSFTFPYLDPSDIKIEVNGTLTTAYTLANATTIQFNTAPANGATIRIYRDTDIEQLSATFFPGSAIRANDLNDDFTQALYKAQELEGLVEPLASLQGTYYGAYAANPTLDPFGNPIEAGDLYFNTTLDQMYVYNGSTWQQASADATVTRFKYIAAGGETSLSGADSNSNVLAYNVGLEMVYLNGAFLTRGVDYTATNGSSITGLVALTAGDVAEIVVFSQINAVGSIPGASIVDGTITNLQVAAGAAVQSSKLAFTQAGTGAVTRTVDSKLKDVVSVKDFGAVGDGVTDDRSRIASAVTASSGKTLRASKGSYSLASDYVVPEGDIQLQLDPGAIFVSSELDCINVTKIIGAGPTLAFNGLFKNITSSYNGYKHVVGYSSYLKGSTPNAVSVAIYGNAEVASTGHEAFGLNVGTYVTADGVGVACELDSHVVDPNGDGYALLLDSIGSYPSRAAIVIQNNSAAATFDTGISFNNANGTGTITPGGSAIRMNPGSAGSFIDASQATFTVAEMSLPSFAVGPTPASLNAAVLITGSASGLPTISGAGSASAIGLSLKTKGNSASTFFQAGDGAVAFRVLSNTGTTDYSQMQGGSGGAVLATEGASANSTMFIRGKGTAGVSLQDGALNSKIAINVTGIGFFGAAPVARQTYGAPTGTLTRTTFDTASVTTAQLAERLAALIADLRQNGLLG